MADLAVAGVGEVLPKSLGSDATLRFYSALSELFSLTYGGSRLFCIIRAGLAFGVLVSKG